MSSQYVQSMDNIGEINTMSPNVPEFEDKWEENEYCHGMIAQALNNLSERIKSLEEFVQKFPEPGPNMIQYKPEGYEGHLNIKELFDDLYSRLNTLDDRIK